MGRPHAGWRTRGYLPHYDCAEQIQHAVFRLADSLPPGVEQHIERLPKPERAREAEGWLDSGHGSRILADARAAAIVRHTLLGRDGEDYRLIAWCIMPTHVHVLFGQGAGTPLSSTIQAWKSVSAHRVNRALRRVGRVWAREYFDRAMFEEGQTDRCRSYILCNPVKARLCTRPEDWRWSGVGTG